VSLRRRRAASTIDITTRASTPMATRVPVTTVTNPDGPLLPRPAMLRGVGLGVTRPPPTRPVARADGVARGVACGRRLGLAGFEEWRGRAVCGATWGAAVALW